MALEVQSPSAFEFITRVEKAYARLTSADCADRETGLGGKLLYAGELDGEGRALVAAANIAGAASLSATADRAAQKQAVRDGVTDFLVNSLDESLRILKNQLRKRETVAVCVGLAPEAVEAEMRERGVLPDLLRGDVLNGRDGDAATKESDSLILTWSVAAAPAKWLPKIDAIALDLLGDDVWQIRRWLRLSPRYLGRLAQGLRLVRCAPALAIRFVEEVRLEFMRRVIGTAVEFRLQHANGHVELHRLAPDHSESTS